MSTTAQFSRAIRSAAVVGRRQRQIFLSTALEEYVPSTSSSGRTRRFMSASAAAASMRRAEAAPRVAEVPMGRLVSQESSFEVTSKPCEVCSKLFATRSGLDLHTSSRRCDPNRVSPTPSVGDSDITRTFDEDVTSSHGRGDEHSHAEVEPVSCPVCSDEFLSEKNLSLHLAAMPRKHGSARRFRHVPFSREDTGWLSCFVRAEPVHSNVLRHTTSLAALDTIKAHNTVHGAPGTDMEEVLGAMSLPGAPPSVYTFATPSSHRARTRISYFPLSAEPAEELCTINLNLNSFGVSAPESQSSEHANGYRMYLCGMQMSNFGPVHRSNITAVVLLAKDSLVDSLSDEFRERIMPLDPDDNPLLYRTESGSDDGGGEPQWEVATKFTGLDESSSSGWRPLRVVVAVGGDVPLAEMQFDFVRTFRAQIAADENLVCPVCDVPVDKLTSHMLLHDESRLQCPEPGCSATFRQRQSLNRHYRTAHQSFRVSCTECDAVFTTQSRLNIHVRMKHEGAADLLCTEPDCTARYRDPNVLAQHIKSVHRKIRVKCDECGATFGRKSALLVHRRTAHEEVRIPCEACDATFTQSTNLSLHMRSRHRGFYGIEFS